MNTTGKQTRMRATLACLAGTIVLVSTGFAEDTAFINRQLREVLRQAGFSGRVESTLEKRLGRQLDRKLADAGRQMWFDVIGGLHNDNTCGGCHSPGDGMGDSQSIAIGIQNNNVVGPGRSGPRNQRRVVINPCVGPDPTVTAPTITTMHAHMQCR